MSDRPTLLERGGLRVPGRHGELVVADGEIVISDRGANASSTGEVRAPVSQVRGATVVPARPGRPGWLHVAVVDGSPAPPGQMAAVGDPYTLILGLRNVGAARRFARAVDAHVHRRGLPSATLTLVGSTGVSVTDAPRPALEEGGSSDWVERLGEVVELHRQGLLTEDELAAARTRLLAEG